MLSLWLGHCESSLNSFDEFTFSAKQPPTLRPSQPTWAVGLPLACYCLHPPSPFIIITQHKDDNRFIVLWFTYPQTITHLYINEAQCRLTMLIETNVLTPSHTSNTQTMLSAKHHTSTATKLINDVNIQIKNNLQDAF